MAVTSKTREQRIENAQKKVTKAREMLDRHRKREAALRQEVKDAEQAVEWWQNAPVKGEAGAEDSEPQGDDSGSQDGSQDGAEGSQDGEGRHMAQPGGGEDVTPDYDPDDSTVTV